MDARFALLLGCFVLFPIYWIFTMSLKEFGDIIAYPPRFTFAPTFENYREVLFGSEADQAGGIMPERISKLGVDVWLPQRLDRADPALAHRRWRF